MWFLQPVVLPLPFVFESHSITYEDLSARAMWPAIPFDQRAYNAVNEINGKLYWAQKSQVWGWSFLKETLKRVYFMYACLYRFLQSMVNT